MVLGHPLAQLFLVVRSVRMVQLAQPLQGEAEYSALAAAVRYGQRIRSCAEAGGQMRHRLLVCRKRPVNPSFVARLAGRILVS
jgi:hypothetical protein